MPVVAVALLLLIGLWVLLARGAYRRRWTGESRRLFEREWDVKKDKQKVHFAVPSFKSAYFDIRPATPWSKLQTKILSLLKVDVPTPLETHFHALVEDPQLSRLFSDRMPVLDALVTLRELGDFRLISTGGELHGYLKPKTKLGEDFLESPEFQKATEAIGQLLDVQFDLPLNEMKPREIGGWRWSTTLPLAMLGAGLVVLLLRPLFVTGDLMLEPRAFKVWLGLSLFATGLGLLWSSMRVPPHYFLRTALAYAFFFSWSAFFWLHGVFTSVNRMFASQKFVIECQIAPDSDGTRCLDGKISFRIPDELDTAGATHLKMEASMGWLGQVFYLSANPEAAVSPEELTTEAPAETLPVSEMPGAEDEAFAGGDIPPTESETGEDDFMEDATAGGEAGPDDRADTGAPPVTLEGLPEMGADIPLDPDADPANELDQLIPRTGEDME